MHHFLLFNNLKMSHFYVKKLPSWCLFIVPSSQSENILSQWTPRGRNEQNPGVISGQFISSLLPRFTDTSLFRGRWNAIGVCRVKIPLRHCLGCMHMVCFALESSLSSQALPPDGIVFKLECWCHLWGKENRAYREKFIDLLPTQSQQCLPFPTTVSPQIGSKSGVHFLTSVLEIRDKDGLTW